MRFVLELDLVDVETLVKDIRLARSAREFIGQPPHDLETVREALLLRQLESVLTN